MTSYRFSPSDTTAIQNWSDPGIWSTGSVPNSVLAEVQLPQIIDPSSGQSLSLQVDIQSGQSFQVGDLDILYGSVANSGTLTAAHAIEVGALGSLFDYHSPGTYRAQSLENDGQITSAGQYAISGIAVNRGMLYGSFTLAAGTFDNAGGTLQSTGNLIVASSGFANLSNGTLTGGTYFPLGGNITFEVNGPITTLAATVSLVQGTLQTYAASGTSLVTLQSSLSTIAPSGFLFVDDYANAKALTVAGTVIVNSGSLNAPSLTIAATGIVALSAAAAGTATLSGGITDNGLIAATVNSNQAGDGSYYNSNVVIGGAVLGTGTIVVGPSVSFTSTTTGQQGKASVSLELTGADSASILFADNDGTLQLDAPQSVTGAIKGFTNGDTILLSGVTLSSIVGTTYNGDATHGILTLLQSGGSTLSLAFQGNYAAGDFTLAPGTSPSGIILTDTGASPTISYNSVEAAMASAQGGTLTSGSMIVTAASDVATNLDMLQGLKASGQIGNVVLTDLTLPSFTVTAQQFLADAGALGVIDSAYSLTVTGATASQAQSIAGGAHVTSVAVSDSAANIASQFDALTHLAATGQVSSIAVTDASFTTIALTSAQLANDRAELTEMTGYFNLSVAATAPNLELDGIDGHATTAIFSGTASQYGIGSAGDGVGVTITSSGSVDLLRSVSAVQFSDFTDLIAQTPGSGAAGSVTTGNVTELYGAVFGRLPDLPGLAYYQNILEQNPALPLTTFAQWFLASPEYVNNPAHSYAQSTAGDTQFIDDSYSNLLHRAPEQGAVPYYLNIIQFFTNGTTPGTQAYTAAQALAHAVVLTDFSASAEFLQDVQVTAQTPTSAQHWLILI